MDHFRHTATGSPGTPRSPWRRTRDPYRIWLSEVILQQTRVAQGMDYALRAPRRRSLPRSGGRGAQVVAGTRLLQPCVQPARCGAAGRGRFEAMFPRSYDEVRSLRGVGDYTAAAVCSAAYDAPAPCSTAMFSGCWRGFRYRPSDRLHGRKAHVR
ncbi:MAG: hypothetical protein ACLRMJ_11300 [Alistipes finegoldii]